MSRLPLRSRIAGTVAFPFGGIVLLATQVLRLHSSVSDLLVTAARALEPAHVSVWVKQARP